MPWVPELFSAPALAKLEDRLRQDEVDMVPYYAGLLTGECAWGLGPGVPRPEGRLEV